MGRACLGQTENVESTIADSQIISNYMDMSLQTALTSTKRILAHILIGEYVSGFPVSWSAKEAILFVPVFFFSLLNI